MDEVINMSRRNFISAGIMIGGGLLLGVSIPHPGSGAAERPELPYNPNAFIHIGTDDSVTIIVNKSEMGQGIYTALPMLVAEELACDWKRVRVESAPVAAIYNHTAFGMQMTGGSSSVWSEYDRLRQAGAAGREMLIAAAARLWKADSAECRARDGEVIHSSGKRAPYGKLAEMAAKMPVPEKVSLKAPSAYTLIGKSLKRLDTPAKVDGTAVFGIDVRLPGMLTAVIARSPVFGGKVKSFNSDKAKAVPGVREVVQIPSGVAVVADGFWPARMGRAALEISWDEGPNAGLSTEAMRNQYADLAKKPGTTARKEGDAGRAFSNAAKQLSAEYEVPYLAHATMEPLNCTVEAVEKL